ncbi:exodeoxyribonuclease V subunit gamma [Conexibacter sp. DBS9H8]|uniref:exodeoxyribonuclease V subunit gamma n=1 Tax=Conexibacter sp. DBS9H8 TaxID=2937801 RepID=UPI00200CC1AC|nr:exodeoxyribonuclease V subunit gamma [Conexibacter sp. DBS9H8]
MLLLHRSDRADALVDTLAKLLADTPADPFAREVVAVPTPGMERWLTQELSQRLGTAPGRADGVCAAVDFPTPGRLLHAVLSAAGGEDGDADPWPPERLIWPLLGLVEELAEEPWLAPLARHLHGETSNRYLRVARVAALFDHYGLHRPEMVRAWAAGSGGEHWQPELWRRLRDRLGVPSLPERLADACARLRETPEIVGLPPRIACFGLTRLAGTHMAILEALAAGRAVHLMLLHPSPALWRTLAGTSPPRPLRRAEDGSVDSVAHRLLASWGRDVRELQLLLSGVESRDLTPETGTTETGTTETGTTEADAPGSGTLLGRLQADIRADRSPPGPPPHAGAVDGRIVPAMGDRSIRVHACHGRARQVAVLREAILHRFAADPTLKPRDVIVMCPDVEEFAPLIQAVFSDPEPGGPTLAVRLADRSLRQTNPLLDVAARLLELTAARLTASEVLDFIDAPPVRHRFHLDGESVAHLRSWVVAAAIHWGLDGAHREPWGLGAIEAGTWAQGLRRLLLSVAVAPGGTDRVGPALAVAEIDSAEIGLAGTLAEIVERLRVAVTDLRGPHSPEGWVQALMTAVDRLALPADGAPWQREELSRLLDRALEDAGGADLPLSAGEARALLGARLQGRPTRANFRTGHLTVCTLHPMRSIPHRVVCLLGLDDGTFPRHGTHDGDDLLAADPHVGDRDARSEDRQLLLDALMAAEEALIITYSGHDERTNAPLPPAVPVGELLDVIEATAHGGRDSVLIRHPLQRFDPRNFQAGAIDPALTGGATGTATPAGTAAPARAGGSADPGGSVPLDGAWSFDADALAGACALSRGPATAAPGFLPAPLPPPPVEPVVSLEDLVAFAQRPARAFLRQRLGVSVSRWEDEMSDALAVEFDGLDRYGVGQRLLEAALAGADPAEAIDAEIARGLLPPGELGRPVVERVSGHVAVVAQRARASVNADPRTFQSTVPLSADRRLTGTVANVHDRTLLSVTYARLNARARLAAWVRLLALTAAHPDVAWEAVTIGRAELGSASGAVTIAHIPALGADPTRRRAVAVAELERLLALREEGLTRPFVAPAATADAYVRALAAGTDADQAALGAWTSGWSNNTRTRGEDAEPEHARCFGAELPLAGLAADAPRLWEGLSTRERIDTQ